MPLTLTAQQISTATIRLCSRCLGLCAETQTGVFEHITNVCRECLPSGGQDCEYENLHGQQKRFEHGQGLVPCLIADPQACQWCHEEIVVTHDGSGLLRNVCIDHQRCCGNCCNGRQNSKEDPAMAKYVWVWESPSKSIYFSSRRKAQACVEELWPGGTWAAREHYLPCWEYHPASSSDPGRVIIVRENVH